MCVIFKPHSCIKHPGKNLPASATRYALALRTSVNASRAELRLPRDRYASPKHSQQCLEHLQQLLRIVKLSSNIHTYLVDPFQVCFGNFPSKHMHHTSIHMVQPITIVWLLCCLPSFCGKAQSSYTAVCMYVQEEIVHFVVYH